MLSPVCMCDDDDDAMVSWLFVRSFNGIERQK